MIRVAITGDPDFVDALTTLCARSAYRVVAADGFGVAAHVSCQRGQALLLDTVEGPLETRLESNLEQLDARFGCGKYLKVRASGNRDPRVVHCHIPIDQIQGVVLALYRALLQCYPPDLQVVAGLPSRGSAGPSRRRRWWWPFSADVDMAIARMDDRIAHMERLLEVHDTSAVATRSLQDTSP